MELFSFGFSGPELMVLLLIILVVLGPKHLVQATHTLSKVIALAKNWSARLRQSSASDLAASGLGEVDWKNYDPRQFDPRRLIREAVKEEMDAWVADLNASDPPKNGPTGTGDRFSGPKSEGSVVKTETQVEDSSGARDRISPTASAAGMGAPLKPRAEDRDPAKTKSGTTTPKPIGTKSPPPEPEI